MGNYMMRYITSLFIVLTLGCAACPTAQARDMIDLEVMGGYGLASISTWDVRVTEVTKLIREVSSDDDSYYEGGYAVGLSLLFAAREGTFRFHYGVEALMSTLSGELKVTSGPQDDRRSVREDLHLDCYKVSGVLGFSFGSMALRPYILAGLGTVLTRMEIGGHHLDDYGAVVTLAGGADYYFTDWFTVGLQARFSDMMELIYRHDPGDERRIRFKNQIFPLVALARVGFHF